MKRIGLLMVCIAALAMASCGSLSSAASGSSVAKASGQACGTAVQGLYNSYHNTGKVDLTNTTDLTNALALATCYTQLKENKDNSAYRSAFTSGLIASSANLITSANATAFVDKLLGSTSLGNLNMDKVTQTASTAAAIISLISILKQ